MGILAAADRSRAPADRPRTRRLASLAPSLRRAAAADVPALARLVNRAYAVEAWFVDGDRTSEADIRARVARGQFLVLDGADGTPAAAVHVLVEGARGRFEMLAVAPEVQGLGLGTRIVAVVEALCAAQGCTVVDLDVVDVREELSSWYRSLGYREVGTAPFEHPGARRPCHYVCLEKRLTT